MKGIADTGFLVAFVNGRDKHHDWAVSIAKHVTEPLLTCEAVLAEAAFHLGSVTVVLEMIATGLIVLAFDAEKHLPHLAKLAERFADQGPDFADMCLVRMSELFPDHSVITTDETDFRIYRRNKREVIPVVCPSGRGRR